MPVIAPGAGASLWTPLRLPSLLAWYDAADTSTLVVSGSSVSQWCDKSRNALAATQATGANQPTLGSTRAGLNVLQFGQGVSTWLRSRTFTSPQPLSVFAVAASDVTDSTNRQITGNDSASPTVYKVSTWRMYAGGDIDSGVTADTNWHVFSALFNGTTSTLRLDGRQIGSGDAGTTGYTGSNTIILGNAASGGTEWKGKIAEVVILARAVGIEERLAVERYLGTKWQIPLSAGGASSPPLEFR